MTVTDLVSQAEFARLHSVSRKTVTLWKQRGLLSMQGSLVDVEASDAILRDHELGRFLPDHPQADDDEDDVGGVDDSALLKNLIAGLTDVGSLLSKAEAERVKENYLAAMRKLQFEKEAGKLVEAEPVKKHLFDLWRRERDAWLTWPARVGAIIAAELGADQAQVNILLEKHVREHLDERAGEPTLPA